MTESNTWNLSVFEHMVHTTIDSSTSGHITSNNVSASASLLVQQASRMSDLVDETTRAVVVEIVNCYLLPVIFIFGAVGNIMSFVVLLVHGSSTSTNILLLGVTVSDFGYLVSMYCRKHLFNRNGDYSLQIQYSVRKVSCIVSRFDYSASTSIETGLIPNVYMINRIFGMTTPFLTMLITLERCLAVSLPLTVQTIVTPRRMTITIIGIFLFATGLQLPFFFIYYITWETDKATGKSTAVLAGTSFYYKNFQAITTYNNIVLSGIFYYGPMIVVVTCTAIVVLIIKRSARWRKATSKFKASDLNKESRTTGMLMAVAVVYIVCYLPSCVTLVVNTIVPDFGSLGGRYTHLFYLVSALQLLLFACNSSVNFIIYMLMSRKFFKTYCRIFLCWKAGTTSDIKTAGDISSSTVLSTSSHKGG